MTMSAGGSPNHCAAVQILFTCLSYKNLSVAVWLLTDHFPVTLKGLYSKLEQWRVAAAEELDT